MFLTIVVYSSVRVEGKTRDLVNADKDLWLTYLRLSGIFLKPDIAKLASRLLLDYADVPPDIIIQQCLRGELPECRQCSQSLVTSKTLLMYHIGFNTSTSVNRVYKKDEFQCGWRHPFVSVVVAKPTFGIV